MSLFTLLGPGRHIILEGVKSLFKGAPNMNTLVGLGALSSFGVSSLAVLIPKLVSDISLFPYMALVFVFIFLSLVNDECMTYKGCTCKNYFELCLRIHLFYSLHILYLNF
uniref:Uncharacterized protein n=1 Tax=Rhizophora mucronata TaxID=61149 RepID=A0A2P2KHW2_RHIMU